MPLSTSAAPPGSGPERTCPSGGIKWMCGFAVKAFGGGTEARGPEESELQAATMHATAAVQSTVNAGRRQHFTGILRWRCTAGGRNSDATDATGTVAMAATGGVLPARTGWGVRANLGAR